MLTKTSIRLNSSFSIAQLQIRGLKFQPIESNNIVKIGHKMTQEIDKKRLKFLEKQSSPNTLENKTKKLLISCSNSQYNHYTNQRYKDQGHEKYIYSSTWFNRRSAGKYFTINSFGKHPSQPDENQPIKFEHMNINKDLIELLKVNLKIKYPTNIQQMSISEILNHLNHFLVVSETSGGKTLAYLLPIIESIIRLNILLEEMNINRAQNEPIGIICVPTRELAFQVYDVLKSLFNFDAKMDEYFKNKPSNDKYVNFLKNFRFVIDLKEGHLMAREKVRQLKFDKLCMLESKDINEKPIDLLITIPSILEAKLSKNLIKSTYLRKLVFDEADTLLDDSFNHLTLNCIRLLKINLNLPKLNLEQHDHNEFIKPSLKDLATQLVFVSATTPHNLRKYLSNLINPEMDDEITPIRELKTSKSNRLMLHVPQKFIRSNGQSRVTDFLETVKKSLDKNRTLLIFSNRTNTAIYVSKFLKENQIDCELITKMLSNEEREVILNKFSSGKLKCLSATDIASRGWDTLQVNHVINFEMPIYLADYVHRIGRVGRLNSKSANNQITSYVTKAFELNLVMDIEKSVRFNTDLKNIDGNIKKLIRDSFMSKNNIQ